jgi:hypothetical protein
LRKCFHEKIFTEKKIKNFRENFQSKEIQRNREVMRTGQEKGIGQEGRTTMMKLMGLVMPSLTITIKLMGLAMPSLNITIKLMGLAMPSLNFSFQKCSFY